MQNDMHNCLLEESVARRCCIKNIFLKFSQNSPAKMSCTFSNKVATECLQLCWTKIFQMFSLHEIPELRLIFWCGNFMEKQSFCSGSGESPKTQRKLCYSTKFPHKDIMQNFVESLNQVHTQNSHSSYLYDVTSENFDRILYLLLY